MSRVMLITGASRGIGAATARLAAHQGYALCLNYHQREDAVKQVLEQVHAAGVSAITVKADVADEGQVVQMFEMIDREFGRLDVLVNNAGMLEQQMRLEQMDAARWTRVL
ncbi:MAG: sugar dehydrogenase, partial [Pseudomonas sp. BICA1-14]